MEQEKAKLEQKKLNMEIKKLSTQNKEFERKIHTIQSEGETKLLAQSKAKADELKKLKTETSGLMNKLKSTTEELTRDEEGIKLLQKMVDDRKNDVSKLAS